MPSNSLNTLVPMFSFHSAITAVEIRCFVRAQNVGPLKTLGLLAEFMGQDSRSLALIINLRHSFGIQD